MAQPQPTTARPRAPRLRSLSASERQALIPLAERGAVAFVESHADGTLKQVTVATLVRAPAQAIFTLVSQPETYPTFVPNISSTRVVERRGNMVAYHWTWHGPLTDLAGSDAMILYPPRRIDMEATGGDFGTGSFRWEFFPMPDGRTLVVHSLFSDARQANYILRQLVASDPSMMHATNLSSGFVLLMGVKTKIEQMAGVGDGRRPTGGVSGTGNLRDVAGWLRPELLPLLRRGEIAIVQMDARSRVRQATAVALVEAAPAAIQQVLLDPAGYPAMMRHVRNVEVVERNATEGTTFDWELVFPIINVSGRMRVRARDAGAVLLESPEGDLAGGRWAWETASVGGETVIAYSSRVNLGQANWFLRTLIQQDPFFLHGLSCAANVMGTRAVQHHFAAD